MPTERFVSPWVYSWKTTSAASLEFVDGFLQKYICIRGEAPSAGVDMFALSLPELSLDSARTASLPSPGPLPSASANSKLRAAWVKPIGALARWSWKRLTR